VVPVAAQIGRVEGHDHYVADPAGDLVVATGARVRLVRLIGLDAPDLDAVDAVVVGPRLLGH